MIRLTVEKPSPLLEFLLQNLRGYSRSQIKSFLTHSRVAVNDSMTTVYDFRLSVGDVITILPASRGEVFRHPQVRLVYEDDSIIVIDKKEGLLSIATDKDPIHNTFRILSDYLKRSSPSARIFVVHRLDRETSGLMMFAKSEQVKDTMQSGWRDLVLDRRYVAVVEGSLPTSEGDIRTYLTEDANRKVWVTDRATGKIATTSFRRLAAADGMTLVEFRLDTGRKNQIRAHMEWMGCPIVGDRKYSAVTNPLGRVALHAYRLEFVHPVTGKTLSFSTPVPEGFEKLVGLEKKD